MRNDAFHLARFIHRLHRRLFFLRLLESSAIGLAAASALSVLLLPLFILREKPTLPVVTILLPLGALIGAIWPLLRRPRMLDTVTEADRQLNLADLLATAWTLARRTDASHDPFEQAVLQIADARAATLSPSSVILNRLNARAWTGIGLTSALALTLALLSANPIISQANSPHATATNPNVPSRTNDPTRSSNRNPGARATPLVKDHPNPQDENAFNPARRTTQVTGNPTDSSNDTAAAADPTGSGPGTGASRSPAAEPLANAAKSTPRNQSGSTPGSGGGATSDPSATRNGDSSISASDSAVRQTVPTWTTTRWPSARSTAERALRSGAVPSQYHDLIRSYFNRDDQP
jgi:hypothetical protein